jgi:hypothetical protein
MHLVQQVFLVEEVVVLWRIHPLTMMVVLEEVVQVLQMVIMVLMELVAAWDHPTLQIPLPDKVVTVL